MGHKLAAKEKADAHFLVLEKSIGLRSKAI